MCESSMSSKQSRDVNCATLSGRCTFCRTAPQPTPTRAIANVVNLRERFASGDSMRMRAVLREAFDQFTLYYTHFELQNMFTHTQMAMHPF